MDSEQESKGVETRPDPVEEKNGHSPFPVVGIGASAGGLEAFSQLLAHLPANTGMAYLFVQHLDPHHESKLSELLARVSSIPVLEAVHGMSIRPDRVYVIPPNANMALAQGILHITPRAEGRALHLPVDYLFRSLADDQQGRAIGVVLSGTGSDGTLGLCEIKAVGGITFAQDEGSAKHTGMPRSAVDSGCTDFILTPEEIAARLAEIREHPYLAPAPPEDVAQQESEAHFNKILAVILSVKGVDFSQYRDTTIKRRIMRRMALHTHQSWEEYVERLKTDRKEVDALYHDILINVTSFFRDEGMFDALKTLVYPEILNAKGPTAPLRVWIPGCSTGQEAYSIAISLMEFYDDKPGRPPIQIFATDLSDQTALDKARTGVYPETIEDQLSPERLRRFFKREDHVYRIDKTIRDMCVFARQNVTADPPFSHIDLISCRNVLIYLALPLQKRVLPTFHYALNVPGFLVLGTAETVGENADLFELVDRSHKIYSKKAAATRLPAHYPTESVRAVEAKGSRRFRVTGPAPLDFQREADRVLLGRFAPPGVLVDENLEIVQYRGRTSAFLEAPSGEPTRNVLKMAREGLFLPLRSALNEARTLQQAVRREGLVVRHDGRIRAFTLEVVPIRPPGAGDGFSLILFHSPSPSLTAGTDDDDEVAVKHQQVSPQTAFENERALIQLRQELVATKEYLQSMVEQEDAANEELRSANEEILSSNEELQSTNEELETAKEELQSANEELTTVNEQLQHRNLELTQSNNDLTNLMSSTNIPVVMIGGDLRIRRFTPPAKKVMSLLPTDVGRPIGDIKPAVIVQDLESIIQSVIENVHSQERTVRDRDGRWHSLRIYPYRTEDRKVDGAVLLLVDIDQQKRSEESLREADRRKDEFLATLAHELRNPIAPIRNAVEIMRMSGNDAASVFQAREVLYRQLVHLSRIIEDLIDVSRIVEKKIELRRDRVDLSEVIETAVETCRSAIEGRHLHLQVTLPAEKIVLYADPVRLGQVFINVLNNASKFTEPGGRIWLSAEIRTERRPWRNTDPANDYHDETPFVVVKIRDTGIGIPAELIPRVFDMFIQGERSLEKSSGGLGVGLSLARALIQMHDGDIEVQSPGTGRGSEFTLHIPLAAPKAVEAKTIAVPAPPTKEDGIRRILVVDDNLDQAQSLGLLLKLLGHEVRLAYDGPSAVQTAIEFLPDVALLDIGIPGLSGYEVARRLRKHPDLADIMIVAQTGWGQDDDRQRARDAGFDRHLVKPIDFPSLKEIIALSKPRNGAPPADAVTAGEKPSD